MPWVLCGDYARVLRGASVPWHGFELRVSAENGDAADRVLTRLGMRHEMPEAAQRTVDYHFDGADVRLVCVPGAVEADLTVPVLGVPVPLAKEADA